MKRKHQTTDADFKRLTKQFIRTGHAILDKIDRDTAVPVQWREVFATFHPTERRMLRKYLAGLELRMVSALEAIAAKIAALDALKEQRRKPRVMGRESGKASIRRVK